MRVVVGCFLAPLFIGGCAKYDIDYPICHPSETTSFGLTSGGVVQEVIPGRCTVQGDGDAIKYELGLHTVETTVDIGTLTVRMDSPLVGAGSFDLTTPAEPEGTKIPIIAEGAEVPEGSKGFANVSFAETSGVIRSPGTAGGAIVVDRNHVYDDAVEVAWRAQQLPLAPSEGDGDPVFINGAIFVRAYIEGADPNAPPPGPGGDSSTTGDGSFEAGCPSTCTGDVPEQACIYCQAACLCFCAGDTACQDANNTSASELGGACTPPS